MLTTLDTELMIDEECPVLELFLEQARLETVGHCFDCGGTHGGLPKMDQLLELLSPEEQVVFKKMLETGPPECKMSRLWDHDILPGFTTEPIQYAYENWNIQENYVFVVSFPKTGLHWLGEIIQHVLYQDKKKLALSHLMPLGLRFIETEGNEKFGLFDKQPFERKCMATHLPAELMNVQKIKEANAKVVYVLRNPKDQIVSWLKFVPKLPIGQIEPWKSMLNSGWDKYFEHVVAGDFAMHSKPGEWYPEHILSWYKHRDNKTVYFVFYEDLKKDPVKEIKLLANFLQVDLSEDKAEEIAAETAFDKMKQNSSELEIKTSRENFNVTMRKGGVGGWKDYFTVRQSERIDAMLEEKLKDTDIKFTYEL